MQVVPVKVVPRGFGIDIGPVGQKCQGRGQRFYGLPRRPAFRDEQRGWVVESFGEEEGERVGCLGQFLEPLLL